MSTLQTSAPPRINDTPEQTHLNAFFAEKTPAGAAGGTMQMARSPRKPLAQLEGELGAQVRRRSVAAGGSLTRALPTHSFTNRSAYESHRVRTPVGELIA